MKIELSEHQRAHQHAFRAFVDRVIVPEADRYDRLERTPPEAIAALARQGYLGAILPPAVGGLGLDMISFGLLHEEIGRGCSSLRSLLTVHSMVCFAIARWGSARQKGTWLPRLARGEAVGAFALSEPNIGSDAEHVETSATPVGESYVLNGHKRWITYGQIAHVFLLFAQCGGKPIAFLLERQTPGLHIEPIGGLFGTRASMLAELHLDNCVVGRDARLGGEGFGFAAVGASALDLGRYSVACGSVGIGQACLEACSRYTSERRQFGALLKDHQLVQQIMTNMVTGVKAARLLCYQAGYLREIGSPSATAETQVAKYFASTMATRVAADAMQLHGANGCGPHYAVQRYARDARVMEIIEGSTQIQQITIAQQAYTTSPWEAPSRLHTISQQPVAVGG